MAFQNPVGPQPDTQRIVQSGRIFADSFAEELAKLPNVPAFAQGNAIQQTLDQILTQLTQLTQSQQAQQTQLTQINEKLDALTLRISAK